MNLKNLFGSNKNQVTPEFFLAVEIHESLIKSVCWEIVDGEPEVIQVGSFESWEDEESLINGVDASISEAVKSIQSQPRRVILGLPESWFDNQGIHPTKKSLVKHLIDDLGLEAIGVVSTTQAITHYLKKREGIPPTAILIEIFQTKIVVSVIKLGKVEATEEVGASGDLSRDVEEALARMEFDQLPARFVLTDGASLENEQQQLISYPWQDKLPFIHMPKVEVLPLDFSVKAIAMTGGAEAASQIGVQVKPEIESNSVPSENIESNLVIPDDLPGDDLEKLGFSYEEVVPPQDLTSEATTTFSETPKIKPLAIEEDDTTAMDALYAVPPEEVRTSVPKKGIKLPSAKKLFTYFKPFKLNSHSNLPLILGITTPLLLVLVSTLIYFFFGQAEITVVVTPQQLNQTVSIAIAQTSLNGLPTLIANKKTVSGEASQSTPTTGEATVGDRAKGIITIANKTVAPLSLKAGTIITSDNGLVKYTLTNAVSVASKSADPLTFQETYGKATGVEVTASKIGPEGNLSKDSTFAIDNYAKSIAYGVAEADFSGGSSRVVKAVSKADQDKLVALAIDQIKSQTQTEISQSNTNTQALPIGEISYTKKNFSHKVGEEADTVSLDMAGSLDLLLYSQDDLFKLAQEQLGSQLPPGMILTQSGTQIKVENPTPKSQDAYQANANIQANLKPDIDTVKWSSLIAGKSIADAKEILTRITGYQNASAKITPPIPFLSSSFLPLNKITINLVTP